jgi:hypothetical protein
LPQAEAKAQAEVLHPLNTFLFRSPPRHHHLLFWWTR